MQGDLRGVTEGLSLLPPSLSESGSPWVLLLGVLLLLGLLSLLVYDLFLINDGTFSLLRNATRGRTSTP